MPIPLFSRSHGFYQLHFYEQECVMVPDVLGDRPAILLDIQVGKALLLFCQREVGETGLVEYPPDWVRKMYDT